jgi:alkanesulfonate monooxygenase SsuD/methylene tetrahydromethanopterin reductase-like flavin-dependent oxidoreductase (luciferase family)
LKELIWIFALACFKFLFYFVGELIMLARCLFGFVVLFCFTNASFAQMMYTQSQASNMIDAEQEAWVGACNAQTGAKGAAADATTYYVEACDYYTNTYAPLYGASASIEAMLQEALNEGNAGDTEQSSAYLSMTCGDTNATAADNAYAANNYDSAYSFADAGYDNYMAAMESYSNAWNAYDASTAASQAAMSAMLSPPNPNPCP